MSPWTATWPTENDLPIDYGAWISPETANGAPPIVDGSPAQDAGLDAGRHRDRH